MAKILLCKEIRHPGLQKRASGLLTSTIVGYHLSLNSFVEAFDRSVASKKLISSIHAYVLLSLQYNEKTMFGLFKTDPTTKLRRQYHAKHVQAILAQKKGDDAEFRVRAAESDALRARLRLVENNKPRPSSQPNCVRMVDEDSEF